MINMMILDMKTTTRTLIERSQKFQLTIIGLSIKDMMRRETMKDTSASTKTTIIRIMSTTTTKRKNLMLMITTQTGESNLFIRRTMVYMTSTKSPPMVIKNLMVTTIMRLKRSIMTSTNTMVIKITRSMIQTVTMV